MRLPLLLPSPVLLLVIAALVVVAERGPDVSRSEADRFFDSLGPSLQKDDSAEVNSPSTEVVVTDARDRGSPASKLEAPAPSVVAAQELNSAGAAPAPSPYATVSKGSESLQLVEEGQFRAAQEELDRALADAAHEARSSLLNMYHDTVQNLQGEMQNMFGVVKLLHIDSENRIGHLAQQERRLEVALMHGQYGKCCCQPAEHTPQCSWSVGEMLLGPYSKMCDRNKKAYTEFLGTAESGAIEEALLDQCGHDKSWVSYTTNQVMNECRADSVKLAQDLETLDAYVQ